LATFISGLAALPRIVTISDIKLEPDINKSADKSSSGSKLKMSAIAKTYRYLQEDEQ
jgi:type IV pilus assembly protein PilO